MKYFSEDYCELVRKYKNMKLKEVNEEVKDRFKNMRLELEQLMDNLINEPLEKKRSNLGLWQRNGRFVDYIWHRYGLKNIENSNLYIYSGIRENCFYIGLGFKMDNLTLNEDENLDNMQVYIRKRIEKASFDNFILDEQNNKFNYIKSLEELLNLEEVSKIYELLVEIYIEIAKKFYNLALKEEEEVNKKDNNIGIQSLNRVLYGPPGTGKTYNIISETVKIIDNKYYEENKEDRKIIKNKFEEYKEKGQIKMITFHQNYGYEDFIEGIKASTNEGEGISYNVEDGVLKELCEKSQWEEYSIEKNQINSDSNIWKISLGGTYSHPLKTECFEKGEIRIGWDEIEFGSDEYDLLGSNDKSTIREFVNGITKGDIVVSVYNHVQIDGIGIVEGDYGEVEENYYKKRRKVKWLLKNQAIDFKEINGGIKFVQKTLYNLRRVKVEDIIKILKENEERKLNLKDTNKEKPYVLIIDEINRGNISKIFGELITLIEDNKRLGNEEALEVTLPYSKEKFGIPNNLHILGTMNTADRSIALMDTALRRRFEFIEMMPDAEKLRDIKVGDTNIDLAKFLETINKRIEFLYDREHTIGHAYFMGIKTKEDLDNVMKNKIIPLLQEYFYEDWEKVQIVLGDYEKQDKVKEDKFIMEEKLEEKNVLGFDYEETEDSVMSYKVNEKFTNKAYKIYED